MPVRARVSKPRPSRRAGPLPEAGLLLPGNLGSSRQSPSLLGSTLMELALSKEDRASADRMRALLPPEIPAELRERLARGEHATRDDAVNTQRTLNEHGLAVPPWPVEWGGQ